MSAARSHQAKPDQDKVATATSGATTYTHNLMLDAVDALKALSRGDVSSADASLKLEALKGWNRHA